MDPITLLILAVAGLAGTSVVVVSWQAIQKWLNANRIPGGTGRIIREKLQNGNYRVVSGVFDTQGTLQTQRSWEAARLDAELDNEFQRSNGTIVVRF
jgi:hypothetical protein